MLALANIEPPGHDDIDALRQLLSNSFRSPDYRPPLLPDVALKIVRLASSADTDTSQILTLIERDPLIAARVIQVANSPLYGTLSLASILDATVRLGRRTIVQIVMEVALQSAVLSVTTYQASIQRVFDHSLVTAHLSKLVAKAAGVADESVYLSGLLHDIGIIGALTVLADTDEPPKLSLDMWMAVDDLHTEAASIIVHHWKLPEELGAVIRHHHGVNPDPKFAPSSWVVCLAERLATDCGLGACAVHGVDATATPIVQRAKDTLGINDQKWETLQSEVKMLVELFNS